MTKYLSINGGNTGISKNFSDFFNQAGIKHGIENGKILIKNEQKILKFDDLTIGNVCLAQLGNDYFCDRFQILGLLWKKEKQNFVHCEDFPYLDRFVGSFL
jgi:hypothetical protein